MDFKIIGSWIDVKNECRTTVNKDHIDGEPSSSFKKRLLIAEHSPIRLVSILWKWKQIPYYVAMEWARHKFEKYISTQRTDRTGVPREEKRQDAPVDFDGHANYQSIIDAWRKRLCYQATKGARELAEQFKKELKEAQPELSSVLVPNCIYRGGCPELKTCGYYNSFLSFVGEDTQDDIFDIQKRYDLYEKFINHLEKR